MKTVVLWYVMFSGGGFGEKQVLRFDSIEACQVVREQLQDRKRVALLSQCQFDVAQVINEMQR